MKKVLLLAILVTSSLFAQAQKDKKSPEERAQARVEKINEALNLTDTQEKEIYELFLSEGQKGRGQGKTIRDLTKEERQAYINARKEEKAVIYEKIANILDEDQLATFKSMDKSRKPIRVKPPHPNKGKKDPTERIQHKVDKLTETLALTPQQQTQVHALLTAQHTEHQGKRGERGERKELTTEEKEAKKAERKANKAAFDEKMKAILTPDQYATYQTIKPAKGPHGKGKHSRHGGKGDKGDFIENRVNQLTKKLQLTEAQQGQVTTILTQHHDARKAQKGKKDLSVEAKDARNTARKEAKAQLDTAMKSVLTAEQYTIYQKEGKGRSKGKKGKKRKKGKKGKKIEK